MRRKTAHSVKKKKLRQNKPRKRGAASSSKKRQGTARPSDPELQEAIPLDYETTEDVALRAAPDPTAPKLSGGLLGQGTLVKIAPQDWWYVEVERPATASGVLRGWVSSAALRRATAAEKTSQFAQTHAVSARAELRKKMAASIVKFEGRRDPQGHLRVYLLPAGDGGGRYEVAGINDRYHPQEAAKLRDLINNGHFADAQDYAAEVIAAYTDVVAKWTALPAIEAYLRDSAFHRGAGGAARILQMALGVKVDGVVGPETLAALRKAEKDPLNLLVALRIAREDYELQAAGRREKFWKGLVSRWDQSLDFASQLV